MYVYVHAPSLQDIRDYFAKFHCFKLEEQLKKTFQGGELSENDIVRLHERMIGDDMRENISAKNKAFDVLSAYWWVWKYYREIGNPKYIGFFAHRKWLSVNVNGKEFVGIFDDEGDNFSHFILL